MLKDADIITVVGSDSLEQHAYGTVKSLIVNLSGAYYFRHDNVHVTQILGADGKRRFYRKESPLVTPDHDNPGEYLLKAECIKTEDGVFLSKTSPNVVFIDNKPYRKKYTIKIDDIHYLISDKRIVRCYESGAAMIKDNARLLSNKYYPKETYISEKYLMVDYFGDICCKNHIIILIDGNSGEALQAHKSYLKDKPSVSILYDFQDKTNPQESRLIMGYLQQEYIHNTVYIDLLPIKEVPPEGLFLKEYMTLPALIHKERLQYFQTQINDYIVPRYMKNLDNIRASINKNYSDLDEKENNAAIFHIVPTPYGGKQLIHQSGKSSTPIRSKKFIQTGGLKYSFGVEFETSQGLLSSTIVNNLGISCVGDRSIGAGEYVTPPLQGNEGLALIKEICRALNKHTLVDDRCGFHVHVGGLSEDSRPSMNKTSLMYAIRLCSYLEEEIFQTLPPSRNTTLYHCHSIRRYGAINKSNYSSYMGGFVFGPKEWWLAPKQIAHDTLQPFFNFDDYKINAGRNSAHMPQDQWCGGRYKWLNLIHAFFDEGKKTYEIRVFPGTTNFEKAWAYIMLSLAIVNVIDNHQEIIKPGIKLSDVVNAAYPNSPKIRKTLNEFHEARKAKFSRTDLYPKVGYNNQPLTFLN